MTHVADLQQPSKKHYPAALTIAGSDSSGGAGIQADLKTFAALGVYGASAITAVTAQNTLGVAAAHTLPVDMVRQQITACLSDLPIAAIKTGMLADAETIDGVVEVLRERSDRRCPLIIDPVMVATSGARLLERDAVAVIMEKLLPMATLVTPNLPEAAILTGSRADSDPREMGRRLLQAGARAVLIKGGHARGETCSDWLITNDDAQVFEWPRVAGSYHGTGCAYAAAITALLARGELLHAAVAAAGRWLQDQIRDALRPVEGEAFMLPFRPRH